MNNNSQRSSADSEYVLLLKFVCDWKQVIFAMCNSVCSEAEAAHFATGNCIHGNHQSLLFCGELFVFQPLGFLLVCCKPGISTRNSGIYRNKVYTWLNKQKSIYGFYLRILVQSCGPGNPQKWYESMWLGEWATFIDRQLIEHKPLSLYVWAHTLEETVWTVLFWPCPWLAQVPIGCPACSHSSCLVGPDKQHPCQWEGGIWLR